MKFSLVLATTGRFEEVKRFLNSLVQQSYDEFELIVVDQNSDDRLVGLLKEFEQYIVIKHLRSEIGLSKARNIALSYVTGSLVAFPDDDCWYPHDLLANVIHSFRDHPKWDAVTGRTVDDEGSSGVTNFDANGGLVNLLNVWRRGVSITIFLRRELVEKIGCFDELLGVGANSEWKSGEETDYLIRGIIGGANIYYDPRIVVGHPNPVKRYDYGAIQRARDYSPGMGRVLRKYRYPLWFVLNILIRPFLGAILSILRGDMKQCRFYLVVAKGRLRGWFS